MTYCLDVKCVHPHRDGVSLTESCSIKNPLGRSVSLFLVLYQLNLIGLQVLFKRIWQSVFFNASFVMTNTCLQVTILPTLRQTLHRQILDIHLMGKCPQWQCIKLEWWQLNYHRLKWYWQFDTHNRFLWYFLHQRNCLPTYEIFFFVWDDGFAIHCQTSLGFPPTIRVVLRTRLSSRTSATTLGQTCRIM